MLPGTADERYLPPEAWSMEVDEDAFSARSKRYFLGEDIWEEKEEEEEVVVVALHGSG